MKKNFPLFLGCVLLVISLSSCVRAKLFKAEKLMRQKSEARETVLVQELTARRNETASLTKQVGDLNRQIGQLEEQKRNLETEVAAKQQQFGESKEKLASENTRLRNLVAMLDDSLARRQRIIQRVLGAQNEQFWQVQQMYDDLGERFANTFANGVQLEKNDWEVLLTLPDRLLFAPDGVSLTPSGKSLLARLADYLFNHPATGVEVQAFTDNTFPPKSKFQDTWEWSLVRANNICRVLVREQNVNANQLTPVGKGEFFPIASNDTPDGRSENRRTVFLLAPKRVAIPRAE